MKEGDVVIALLPQADGSLKRRPSIILRLMPPFGDFFAMRRQHAASSES